MPTRRTKPTTRTKRRPSPYPSPFDPQPAGSEPEDTSDHEATDSPGDDTASETPKAHKGMAEGAGMGLTRVEEQAVRLAVANPSLSNVEIGRRVGASEHSSVVRGLGTNGNLRAHVRALLDEVGLNDRALMRRWRGKVDAQETKFFAYQGKVLDSRRVVAHEIQLDALKEVTKLARLYPATTEDQDQKTVGPPALMIQLNLGTTSQTPLPSGLSIALGPNPEVNDAQGETAPGGNDTTRE